MSTRLISVSIYIICSKSGGIVGTLVGTTNKEMNI